MSTKKKQQQLTTKLLYLNQEIASLSQQLPSPTPTPAEQSPDTPKPKNKSTPKRKSPPSNSNNNSSSLSSPQAPPAKQLKTNNTPLDEQKAKAATKKVECKKYREYSAQRGEVVKTIKEKVYVNSVKLVKEEMKNGKMKEVDSEVVEQERKIYRRRKKCDGDQCAS